MFSSNRNLNILCVFRVEASFSDFSFVAWTGPILFRPGFLLSSRRRGLGGLNHHMRNFKSEFSSNDNYTEIIHISSQNDSLEVSSME